MNKHTGTAIIRFAEAIEQYLAYNVERAGSRSVEFQELKEAKDELQEMIRLHEEPYERE